MRAGIYIEVDRDRVTGALQLCIGVRNEHGGGDGYRIAGPKYIGESESLMQVRLSERDATAIRAYLDKIADPAVAGGEQS